MINNTKGHDETIASWYGRTHKTSIQKYCTKSTFDKQRKEIELSKKTYVQAFKALQFAVENNQDDQAISEAYSKLIEKFKKAKRRPAQSFETMDTIRFESEMRDLNLYLKDQFAQIPFRDISNYLHDNNKYPLTEITSFQNALYHWGVHMIVSQQTPKEAGKIIERFIKMAQSFKKEGNYLSYRTIMGMLESTAVSKDRLKHSWKHVSKKLENWQTKENNKLLGCSNQYILQLIENEKSCVPAFDPYLRNIINIKQSIEAATNKIENKAEKYSKKEIQEAQTEQSKREQTLTSQFNVLHGVHRSLCESIKNVRIPETTILVKSIELWKTIEPKEVNMEWEDYFYEKSIKLEPLPQKT